MEQKIGKVKRLGLVDLSDADSKKDGVWKFNLHGSGDPPLENHDYALLHIMAIEEAQYSLQDVNDHHIVNLH